MSWCYLFEEAILKVYLLKKSNFEAIDLLQTADLNETKGKSSKF